MQIYSTKIGHLPGTNYQEIVKRAYRIYQIIKAKSKRKPYIRSAYFYKAKIFLNLFWPHLFERNLRDRVRRLKYFPCALELIQRSRFEPTSKQNPNHSSEILHRFAGIAPNGLRFFVQIKEDKQTRQKWLMSVFPDEP